MSAIGPARVSVIVPAIDEAEALAGLLADLRAQQGVTLDIRVVDGGSTDDSAARVASAGATWLTSAPGRAIQMNCGARDAAYEWLCFLHADSRLTDDRQLLRAVRHLSACAGGQPVAGHWRLCFQRQATDRPSSRRQDFLYRYMQAKTGTGRPYTINGDQGLLIRQADFQALGGFDERLAFLEDQRFAATLQRAGAWQQLPGTLMTSARRFEVEGAYARYLLMALIMAMYIVDVPFFFEQAPGVYARQAHTKRLLLMPYFRLLRRMMQRCGWWASLRVCWQMAGVAMRQLWQPVFALDVALGTYQTNSRGRWASRYEQSVAGWVENPITQAVMMIGLLAGLFGPVQALAFCQEKFWRRRP